MGVLVDAKERYQCAKERYQCAAVKILYRYGVQARYGVSKG
jgi:hypothetical protein